MGDFLDRVEAYIAAAKAKATDLASKGADALEEFAAWLRARAGPAPLKADPGEAARVATCKSELAALGAPKSAAAGAVGASPADLLAQVLAAILAAL
jgi:hypothetical protein